MRAIFIAFIITSIWGCQTVDVLKVDPSNSAKIRGVGNVRVYRIGDRFGFVSHSETEYGMIPAGQKVKLEVLWGGPTIACGKNISFTPQNGKLYNSHVEIIDDYCTFNIYEEGVNSATGLGFVDDLEYSQYGK